MVLIVVVERRHAGAGAERRRARRESAARDALQTANLKSQVVSVDVPFGSPQANVVIDQTPGAGEQVAPGSTVTIRIGKPGTPTTTRHDDHRPARRPPRTGP